MSAMGLGGAVAPPCGACGQPVADKLLVAFGMHWHKVCLFPPRTFQSRIAARVRVLNVARPLLACDGR
jgi:hypothetical protein